MTQSTRFDRSKQSNWITCEIIVCKRTAHQRKETGLVANIWFVVAGFECLVQPTGSHIQFRIEVAHMIRKGQLDRTGTSALKQFAALVG